MQGAAGALSLEAATLVLPAPNSEGLGAALGSRQALPLRLAARRPFWKPSCLVFLLVLGGVRVRVQDLVFKLWSLSVAHISAWLRVYQRVSGLVPKGVTRMPWDLPLYGSVA